MEAGFFQFELAEPAWLVALGLILLVVAGTRRSLTGHSRRRQAAGVALRGLVVAAVVLALCRPQLRGSLPPTPAAASETVAAQVQAKRQAKVLLVEGRPKSAERLAEALRAGGLEIQACPPGEIPSGAAALGRFAAIGLVNVPATAIPENEQQLLRDYVRDRGGGLVVVGGDQAFTAGGYHGTILESLLPVESVALRRGERPGLAMVLVVDRSLSMEEGGAMELAKEAMRRTIQMLAPADQLGVLAFDEGSRWVSPIEPLGDKSRVLSRIATLTAGGRTDLGPAMEKAYLALDEAFAARKHIIVLTDGVSHPADFQALAEKIARSGITISTVALGAEACRPLLEDIARTGRGRFYECDDPREVPSVFAQEAASAGRLGIHERPFRPQIGRDGEAFAAAMAGAPPLLGYVETRAKPGAHVALASPERDPLLASWRCGKAVSVAFTSDAEDRWAAAWLKWPGFAPFWTQVFRRALRPDEAKAEVIPAKPQAAALARPAEPKAVPLWRYFLAAATVLFVVDVAARRMG